MSNTILSAAVEVCQHIKTCFPTARPFIVGGATRNQLSTYNPTFSEEIKDVDIEVLGITMTNLHHVLARKYEVDEVGKCFGVLKLKGVNIDVSVPRQERQLGNSHTSFETTFLENCTVAEAGARRDFTFNSIYWDPLQNTIEDPYSGIEAIRQGTLAVVVAERFVEDPLRLYRAMQFVARYNLNIEYTTQAVLNSFSIESLRTLPKERVLEEWKKLILRGENIAKGLNTVLAAAPKLRFRALWPELAALEVTEQEADWHPEGNVWNHTLHCLNHYAKHVRPRLPAYEGNDDRLVVGLAVLCHDLGKAVTTKREMKNGVSRLTALGHDTAGGPLTETLLARMFDPSSYIIAQVRSLVVTHMRPYSIDTMVSQAVLSGDKAAKKGTQTAVRRLSMAAWGRIDLLMKVVECDEHGRPPIIANEASCILSIANNLQVLDSTPRPIIMGRHLVALGVPPGPSYSPILKRVFDAQLDGEFETEEAGIERLKKEIDK